MEDKKQEEQYSPREYFEYIKGKKNRATDEDLKKVYGITMELLEKYISTGQTSFSEKLLFKVETIEKERQLVEMGIDTFVYKDDIEDFIDNVHSNVVKVIELENYEREIPDSVVETIVKTKGIFTQLYVIYTDYSKRVEKKVEKKRRDKDPILFGSFQDKEHKVINDRFYFLGDWIDEYCALTLDKMVDEMRNTRHKEIANTVSTPTTLKELKAQLAVLQRNKESFKVDNTRKKVPFFKKVRSLFG